jgi:signal transduction histidine kinase
LAGLQAAMPSDAQPTVQAVIDEADGLLATFNALLRIAQIESGQRISGFQRLDLSKIVHDVIELYDPLAVDKDIEIVAHLSQPLMLAGDRDLLFQAFANLLDNAIKYTPEHGKVRVDATIEPGKLQIVIADSGPGVPAEERDKIFRRFYRVEASRGEQPGNGLGLSLVQAVIHLHSGSIVVDDNQPGLRVSVHLPVAA